MKARILIAVLAATAFLAAPQSASAEKRRAKSHHPHYRSQSRQARQGVHMRTRPSRPHMRTHPSRPHMRTHPSYHASSRRVWVPAVYETRLVEERVLVREPCRCGRGCRALHRSYWTVRTVAKRVLVREGYWTYRTVTRRVCVRPGHWKTVRPCGVSVRVSVGF